MRDLTCFIQLSVAVSSSFQRNHDEDNSCIFSFLNATDSKYWVKGVESKKEGEGQVEEREEKKREEWRVEVWRGFFLLYKSLPIMKNVSREG